MLSLFSVKQKLKFSVEKEEGMGEVQECGEFETTVMVNVVRSQ